MNNKTVLNRLKEPRDTADRTKALYELLQHQCAGNKLDEKVLNYINRLKTKKPTQIAITGLVIWNSVSDSISKEWKVSLQTLESKDFWDLDNNSIEVNQKIDKVPFDILARIFWGLLEEESSTIYELSRELFTGVDLEIFTDLIILRSSYATDKKLDYFYTKYLSTLSKSEIKNLQKAVYS